MAVKTSKLKRSRKNPHSTYWRNKADVEWSKQVRKRDRGCVICGKEGQAHHLIHRNRTFFRHNLNCGVSLCAYHHTFDTDLSAHGAPWAFEKWMKEHRSEQFDWWAKNRYRVIHGVKINYQQVYELLAGEAGREETE